MKWNSVTKPFKKLLVSQGGSTAGRNSAGHITIFHRGGGAKRLLRKIDLKRSTSSMGVVERIEYDPNRSSRLALVRWIEGVHPTNQRNGDKDFSPPQKVAKPIATEVLGQFPLACLAPPGLMGGNVVSEESGGKISNVKDVFISAFGSKRAKGESVSNIPRVAVAGAKPSVFAPKNRDQNGDGEQEFSLSDVQMWRKDSRIWDHKLKRKAAVPWLSFVNEEPVGLAKAAQIDKSPGKPSKKAIHVVDRAPLTYILASDKLEEGKIVMNYDWSKRPTRN